MRGEGRLVGVCLGVKRIRNCVYNYVFRVKKITKLYITGKKNIFYLLAVYFCLIDIIFEIILVNYLDVIIFFNRI